MNRKGLLAVLLVATMALSVAVPISGASNIQVRLNPQNNEATVYAYINSSLMFSTQKGTLLGNLSSTITGHSTNVTIGPTQLNSSTTAFRTINASIKAEYGNATLKSLALGFSRTYHNLTEGSRAVSYMNTSLLMEATIGGIFQNGTANLSWRGFTTHNSLSLNGNDVSTLDLSNGGVVSNGSTVNTLNLSVFSKSLTNWTRTYDAGTNVTTFSMNAGNIIELSYNGTFLQIAPFTISYTLDPAYSISAPGYDSATSNSIVIGNPPPSSPIGYYAVGAILVGAAAIMLYMRRKGPNH